MLSMLKLLMISSLLISSVFASSLDESIIAYEKNKFSQNSNIDIKKVEVNLKKEMPIKGWYGYIMNITASINSKDITAKDMVFTNGLYVTNELLDIKTGKNLKDMLVPDLSSKYYNKAKLIAGSAKAKDKIVVFSDPLCPYCMDYLPTLIKHVNKNKNSIALYYYHFPLLRLHPASDTLVKAMLVAKNLGIKDLELKVYEVDWNKYFSEKQRDQKVILKAFNNEFKTKITLKQINDKKIQKSILFDVAMGEDVLVQGTPTVFVNKVRDNSKLKYETLGK